MKNSEYEIADMNSISDSMSSSHYRIFINSNDHFPPHFHLLIKQTGDILKINIITLRIYKSTNRKGVSKKNLLTWEGIEYVKKDLKKWLDDKVMKNLTNYDHLVLQWNTFHKNDKELNMVIPPDTENPWN